MTAALILAAGGVPVEDLDKWTDETGGIPPVRRIITAFKQAGIRRIVVITGCDASVMERLCAHMGVIFLRSGEHKTGDMLSSIKLGLEYLKDKCARVFISPADTPFFSIETIKRMAREDAPAVVPVFNTKSGHPLLLSCELFDTVLAYGGSGGIEGALSKGEFCRYLKVSDEGILADMSRGDMSGLTAERVKIRPEVRIRLIGNGAFFGPGTLQLLTLTGETGSLKNAARQMGISYSKAIKMVMEIERQLGFPILISRQGGRYGGGSEITVEGIKFMRRYAAFESECSELISAAFERHYHTYYSGG